MTRICGVEAWSNTQHRTSQPATFFLWLWEPGLGGMKLMTPTPDCRIEGVPAGFHCPITTPQNTMKLSDQSTCLIVLFTASSLSCISYEVLEAALTVLSGFIVTIEIATHYACNDWDKMRSRGMPNAG
jgi:hypothetical protein